MSLEKELLGMVDVLENDLFSPWMLKELSAMACISKFYLHRIFKSLSGMTPMEYLWARRLTVSLEALQKKAGTVTEIAHAHGFADSASYTRAFKRRFGLTPTEYRKRPVLLPICDRLHPYDFFGNTDGVLLRPQVVRHPGFSVVGERHAIVYGENAATNKAYRLGSDFFLNRRHEICGAADDSVYTGLTVFPKDDDRFTWYLPSLEVAPDAIPPKGMEKVDVPPGTCAVFHYAGLHPVSQISARMRPLFEHIYLTWMPQLGEASVPMNYERIPFLACTDEYCEITLYYVLDSAPAGT